MIVKKLFVSGCFLLVSGVAVAEDGVIRFNGSITDQACSIDSGSQALNVDMGNVSQAALNGSAGLKASPTHFTINLENCPSTVSGANIKFDGTPDPANPSLLAIDTETGSASGVGIEIADKNGIPIALHTASSNYPLVTGSNSLELIARYVSTSSSVKTGPANALSQFTIVYK